MKLGLVCAALVAGLWTLPASALTVTFGAGSAVTSVDRTATFDSLADNTDLSTYTENGIDVQTEGFQCCLTGGHYPSSGNHTYTNIKSTDGQDFAGLEVDLATGWNTGDQTVVWEAFKDGGSLGGGSFDIFLNIVYDGVLKTVGFTGGVFDELHLGSGPSGSYFAFGDYNAIGVDNVKFGDARVGAVPLPMTLPLFATGLGMLTLVGRRARRNNAAAV